MNYTNEQIEKLIEELNKLDSWIKKANEEEKEMLIGQRAELVKVTAILGINLRELRASKETKKVEKKSVKKEVKKEVKEVSSIENKEEVKKEWNKFKKNAKAELESAHEIVSYTMNAKQLERGEATINIGFLRDGHNLESKKEDYEKIINSNSFKEFSENFNNVTAKLESSTWHKMQEYRVRIYFR